MGYQSVPVSNLLTQTFFNVTGFFSGKIAAIVFNLKIEFKEKPKAFSPAEGQKIQLQY